MKDIPAALAAHLSGGVTTLCHAWRVIRRDGAVLGFTEHDADLDFAGTTFAAASGFSASDSEAENGLAATTGEVAGGFSADAITEADLAHGRYDGARVEVYLVNWADPAQRMLLRVQEIGEVTRTQGDFRAELRSIAHRLGQEQGRLYGRRCDATLGDGRCRVDLSLGSRRRNGTVLTVSDSQTITASGLAGFASGFFGFGVLTFSSGALAGLSFDIDAHWQEEDVSVLTFWLPVPEGLEEGAAFEIVAGCDKSFSTCRAKFSNHLNFQGFPHIPGADFAYSYADGKSVHDGRPLFQ